MVLLRLPLASSVIAALLAAGCAARSSWAPWPPSAAGCPYEPVAWPSLAASRVAEGSLLPLAPGSAGPSQAASRGVARPLVLARLDGPLPGPLGHALDGTHALRAHEHPHAALDLLEFLGDGLRLGGHVVLVDHGAAGEAALLPATLRERGARLLRGRLRSLRHDQLRGDERSGEIGEISVDLGVELLDAAGVVLLRRDLRLDLREPGQPDMLRLLGLRLGAELLRDPAFLAALGGA
jgi:hypothetical protein